MITISLPHLFGAFVAVIVIGLLIGGQHSDWIRGFLE